MIIMDDSKDTEERWTPIGSSPPMPESVNNEQQVKKDDVYIDQNFANQQLSNLINKVLPKNSFITPEVIIPVLTIAVTLIMSKLDFDKQHVLQTVQDVNGQVVTTYNEWAPIIMAVLYIVLGGGSLGYSALLSKHKEKSRQQVSRAINSMSNLETEKEKTRNLQITGRNLELEIEVHKRQLQLIESQGSNILNKNTESDLSESLKD